jgi:Cas7 group CRISPR-associated protein Csh2
MTNSESSIRRASGLLVVEVINSNPNGDPDRESDPRIRPDERGEISPVSIKRKIRELIEDKEGPVWAGIARLLNPNPDSAKFCILESRKTRREDVIREINKTKSVAKYWDARVFGNTFLEDKMSDEHLRTGVVQFGLGVSVSPVRIERLTTTKQMAVQADKTRGMAPLGYRVVEHGVYTVPFCMNPSAARKSGCEQLDIQVLLKVIPYLYSHTPSYVRSQVEIRHAWYIEHRSALGSASDFALMEALTPRKRCEPEAPSRSWADYEVPTVLPGPLQARVEPLRDLMAESYAAACA